MQNIKKFFKEFLSSDIAVGVQIWRFVLYNNWDRKRFEIIWSWRNMDKIIKEHGSDNIYFQSGTSILFNGKAKIKDIIAKNSGFIDVDIRKNQQSIDGIILSDDELVAKIALIKEMLNTHEVLKDWYCIVNSWNGCHIRYIWDWNQINNDFTADEYGFGMTAIYDEYKQLIIDDPTLYPDYSCTSIEKLARVPGTYNISRREYWLEPIQSSILYFQGIKTNIFTL